MSMIRGGYQYCIYVLLVQQAPKVIVGFCVGMFLRRRGQKFVVHVAQGDEVLRSDLFEVFATTMRNTNERQVELFVRGRFSATRKCGRRQQRTGRAKRRALQ